MEHLKGGGAVFGLAPGCSGARVVLPAGLMVAMPAGITLVKAATLPTVFVTMYTAFRTEGVGPGDKVCVPLSAVPLPKSGFVAQINY